MAQNTLPNKAFFEKVLRSICTDSKDEPKLIDFKAKPVCATGDSYTSNIKRVFIKYSFNNKTSYTLPVILKTQVRGSMVEDWTMELDFFKTEIKMFCEIFPQLATIIQDSLTSKCYFATNEPDFTLALEDLEPAGFVMSDRKIGFDMDHTKGVLKTLARLHAGSVVLATKTNEVKTFTKGLYSDSKVSTQWMSDGLKSLIKTCKSMKECVVVGEKLEALGDDAIKRGLRAVDLHEGGLNVLNHGDMWCNNMLFLHDKDGKPINTKLIDFQLSKFTSPALDLHYFYATSLMNDVRDKRDYILDFYYSELICNLVKFGHSLINIPSRRQLGKDFEERAFYGVIALATVTPLVKAPPHKDANFESLCKNDDNPDSFREFIYSSAGYKESVKQLMSYYDCLGIFN